MADEILLKSFKLVIPKMLQKNKLNSTFCILHEKKASNDSLKEVKMYHMWQKYKKVSMLVAQESICSLEQSGDRFFYPVKHNKTI